jgi:hypothetical protein
VTFESKIARHARPKPAPTALPTFLPARISSRMRSKISTLASTAMPTVSAMPARPGRVSVARIPASAAIRKSMFRKRAITATSPLSR